MQRTNEWIKYIRVKTVDLISSVHSVLHRITIGLRKKRFEINFYFKEKAFRSKSEKALFTIIFKGIQGQYFDRKKIINKTDFRRFNFKLTSYFFYDKKLKKGLSQDISFNSKLETKVKLIVKQQPQIIDTDLKVNTQFNLLHKSIYFENDFNRFKYHPDNNQHNGLTLDKILEKIDSSQSIMELNKLKIEL